VYEFPGFTVKSHYKEALQKILDVAKKVSGESFDDLQVSEVEEFIEEHSTEFTDVDLEKLVKSADEEEEDGDGEAVPREPMGITLDNLAGMV